MATASCLKKGTNYQIKNLLVGKLGAHGIYYFDYHRAYVGLKG